MSEHDEESLEEELELSYESEELDRGQAEEVSAPRVSGNPWALVLTGFGSFFLGFALSMGPKLSWKLGQISEGFAHLGVDGGTLIMGGMLMIGLGMAWRSILSHEPAPPPRLETDFAIDQVASDLNEVRTTMLEYGDQLRAFKKALERINGNLGALPEKLQHALPDPSDSSGPDPDAIFRMAASLDKLWARFDEKLDRQQEAVQGEISKLLSSRDTTVPAQGNLPEPPVAPASLPTVQNADIHDELGVLDDVEPSHGPVRNGPLAASSSATGFHPATPVPPVPPVPPQPTANPGDSLSLLDDEQLDNALRNMRRNAE